jgi:hypothetical protein
MTYANSLAVLQLASTREPHLNWELATLQFVYGIWSSKKLPLHFSCPSVTFYP